MQGDTDKFPMLIYLFCVWDDHTERSVKAARLFDSDVLNSCSHTHLDNYFHPFLETTKCFEKYESSKCRVHFWKNMNVNVLKHPLANVHLSFPTPNFL